MCLLRWDSKACKLIYQSVCKSFKSSFIHLHNWLFIGDVSEEVICPTANLSMCSRFQIIYLIKAMQAVRHMYRKIKRQSCELDGLIFVVNLDNFELMRLAMRLLNLQHALRYLGCMFAVYTTMENNQRAKMLKYVEVQGIKV